MPDDRIEERVTIDLNPRERRFYESVRTRVAHHRPGGRSSVRDIALLLPDLTVLLLRLLRDDRVPPADKALALLGIAYVLSPLDLLPSAIFGPIGLVDDVLVATAAISRILNRVHPDVVRSHWPGQGDALAVVQQVSAWSESLFRTRLPGFLRGLLRTQPR